MIAMRMTVGDFVARRAAHILDHTFEKQTLSGERVIAVDHDFVVGDIRHRINHPTIVFVALRHAFKLHADFNVGGKYTFRFDANQVFIVITECVCRLKRHGKFLTGRFAVQAGLDKRKNAAVAAVKIGKIRISTANGVTFGVNEFAGQGYNGIFGNLHESGARERGWPRAEEFERVAIVPQQIGSAAEADVSLGVTARNIFALKKLSGRESV